MDTQYWRHRTVRGDVCKGLLAGFVACWATNQSCRGCMMKVASGAPQAQAESRVLTERGVGCDAVRVLDRGLSGQEEDLRRLPVAWGGALASARAGAR
jgi:hypothetical protein